MTPCQIAKGGKVKRATVKTKFIRKRDKVRRRAIRYPATQHSIIRSQPNDFIRAPLRMKNAKSSMWLS